MKNTILLLFLSLIGSGAFGQQYKTAVGIKGDWSSLNVDLAQFSVKHFYTPENAFEINFGAGQRFIWLEGMYHYNQPLKNDFYWYAGGGVDLGYWSNNYENRFDRSYSGFWGGTNGVFGIEYVFGYIPLDFALDFGPTIRLIPDLEVGLKVGFAARYAFGSTRKSNTF